MIEDLESREIIDIFGSFVAGCISLSMVVLGAFLRFACPSLFGEESKQVSPV